MSPGDISIPETPSPIGVPRVERREGSREKPPGKRDEKERAAMAAEKKQAAEEKARREKRRGRPPSVAGHDGNTIDFTA